MSTKSLFFIIILFGCLGQFASDIYGPSIPSISQVLHTPLNVVQLTMAIYLLGMFLSALPYGIISDSIGRKKPMILGLLIMVVGSFICAIATHIETLMFGRFIQGLGAGASATLWRSIFRDTYSGTDLAKYGSYFGALITIIMPMAPILGGYLEHYFSWRASFIFLFLYSASVLLLCLFSYKETGNFHSKNLRPSIIKSSIKEIVSHRTFMGISFIVLMTYGGLFAWTIAAPILLMHLGGMTPVDFGWFLFACVGVSFGLAGLLNGRLVSRYGVNTMMRFGCGIMALSGILLFVSYFFWGVSVWDTAPMMILFYFGAMFIFPNANAKAMHPFGHMAGYAAALYGTLKIGGGAILGILVSSLPENNQVPLALLIIGTAVLSWLIFEWTVFKHYPQTMPA